MNGPRPRWPRRARTFVVAASVATGALVWLRCAPIPDDLLAPSREVSTSVLDRHGIPLYEATSSAGLRTRQLGATELPDALVQATLAAEDRRFFTHPGIDPLALGRAVIHNVRSSGRREGGSTITQQVAKLLLDRRAGRPRPRGIAAKLAEAVLALRLEHRFGKREIVALYLNLAPYGNQIAGAARASEVYFGVRPAELTVAQAAFLAGLPQRPGAFNPYRQNAAALGRQRDILTRMMRAKAIAPGEATAARRETLRLRPWQPAFLAPHFVEMVLSSPAASHREQVITTLDAELQQEVAGIIAASRADLERHGAHNVAVAVLDNARGEWLAWEGSGAYDGEHGGAIDGVMAPRQPGSALKPFVYALAFESGDTPATVLPDVPSTYPTAEAGIVYTPRNYDGRFHGPLRARQALAGSQNVPAVELASRVGVPDLLRLFRATGFHGFDRTASYYGLGVALGNAEVTLADLVAGYAAFARGGVWVEPSSTLDHALVSRRVLSARSAFWITDVLADDESRAYVFGRGGNLEFPYPVAVKTGTSQAYRDNWTVGYTRDVTVGVWVGNFDRRPLIGSSGVTGAGPIFHAVMLAAQRHVRATEDEAAAIVERPAGLEHRTICALSGMAAGAACPLRREEWLPAGHATGACTWHHQSDDGVLTLWPEMYRTWARENGLADGFDHPADVPLHREAEHAAAPMRPTPAPQFAIISPAEGATYLIDPTLRADFQTLSLRARQAGKEPVSWFVDGRIIGTTRGNGPLSWPLVRGMHRVSARTANHSAQITISVR